MKWLVWKDYRMNRVIVIAGATLLVMPHVLILLLTWYGIVPSEDGAPAFSASFLSSGLFSLVVSQLTLALLGGNLIACERVDRSAEFLVYLPVSRTRILASKITLALLVAALIWGPNLLILRLAGGELLVAQGSQQVWSGLGYVAITGLVFFSVGWLLSSMLESPTFAICVGLITPLLIVMGGQALVSALGYALDEVAGPWYARTCLTLAPVCLIVGTWYYLRRVEP